MDRGAKGDGEADDTTAFQSAIDEAGAGTVLVPAGTYRVSTLKLRDDGCRLVGVSATALCKAPFGSSAFNASAYFAGSVVRCSDESGAGVLVAARGVGIENLVVLGPGSGTSVGVKFATPSSAPQKNLIRNLHVGNFATGVSFQSCYFSHLDSVSVAGCGVGLHLKGSSNQNVFTNTFVDHCGVGVLVADASDLNLFNGGVIQNYRTSGFRAKDVGTCHNRISSVYFESAYSGDAITAGVGATQTAVEHCHFSGAEQTVTLAANACSFTWPDGAVRMVVGGYSCFLLGYFVHEPVSTRSTNDDTVIWNTRNNGSGLNVSGQRIALGGVGNQNRVGFYGATPTVKPSVETADVKSVLAALVKLGLVSDNT